MPREEQVGEAAARHPGRGLSSRLSCESVLAGRSVLSGSRGTEALAVPQRLAGGAAPVKEPKPVAGAGPAMEAGGEAAVLSGGVVHLQPGKVEDW